MLLLSDIRKASQEGRSRQGNRFRSIFILIHASYSPRRRPPGRITPKQRRVNTVASAARFAPGAIASPLQKILITWSTIQAEDTCPFSLLETTKKTANRNPVSRLLQFHDCR